MNPFEAAGSHRGCESLAFRTTGSQITLDRSFRVFLSAIRANSPGAQGLTHLTSEFLLRSRAFQAARPNLGAPARLCSCEATFLWGFVIYRAMVSTAHTLESTGLV